MGFRPLGIAALSCCVFAAAQVSEKPITIGENVTKGLLITKVPESYPLPSPRSLGPDVRMVTVKPRIVIDTQGRVENVETEACAGDSQCVSLLAEIRRIVSSWVYRPFHLNGVAVRIATTVTFKFSE